MRISGQVQMKRIATSMMGGVKMTDILDGRLKITIIIRWNGQHQTDGEDHIDGAPTSMEDWTKWDSHDGGLL